MVTKISDIYKKKKHGKVSDKWSSYLEVYDKLFLPYLNSFPSVLEIGVQNGGSLEIWLEYFSQKALITGCDINKKCLDLSFDSPRIRIIVGDIKQDAIKKQILFYSSQFDIIIDDGSHFCNDVIQTFCTFFPHLKNNGLYIIEDLHTSYWQEYNGGLYHPHSSYSFFKLLIDVCNYEHWGTDISIDHFMKQKGFNIENISNILSHLYSVEILNSMCIISKKDTARNGLGKRIISGNDENVYPILHAQGSPIGVPCQKNNKFSSALFGSNLPNKAEELLALFHDYLDKKETTTSQQQLEKIKLTLIRAEIQLELLKQIFGHKRSI